MKGQKNGQQYAEEALSKARQEKTYRDQIAILDRVITQLDTMQLALRTKLDDTKEREKNCSRWDKKLLNDQVSDLVSKICECSDCRQAVFSIQEELLNKVEWKT